VLDRIGFSRGRTRFTAISRFSGGVAAAILALAIAAPASVPASPTTAAAVRTVPGPAMWVIQDVDTTVYLFGTFHALDQNSAWFNRSVRAAFDSSDELVLETLVPENPADLHSAIARHSAAKEPRIGEPVYADRGGSSFVASAGQAMSAGRDMGMSVDHGADAVLRRAANASGKPVAGLETFEFQLQMFRSLPPPPAAGRGGQRGGETGGFLGDMQSAWKRGDNAGFASILGKIRSQSPQTYKTLFVDRNVNWAGWIANRMDQPGTVFIAVGTGHLIGPDSVQQHLAARGINSARIS
jgi:uncharacterized protein YbaP (TraB family)